MTANAILKKLQELLAKGIANERDASYLMMEIRKFIEQQPPEIKEEYEYLKFHCDWAMHSQLSGKTTQKILKEFDAAAIQLKAGAKLHELPNTLRSEIENISKMKYFEKQVERLLSTNGLPSMELARPDGWIHFIHLYGKIVEDCPLVMTTKNQSATIEKVTVKLDLAKKQLENIEDEQFFRVRWIIEDKSGSSGSIDIYNSFSSNHDE
jgi:hypothetical protein